MSTRTSYGWRRNMAPIILETVQRVGTGVSLR